MTSREISSPPQSYKESPWAEITDIMIDSLADALIRHEGELPEYYLGRKEFVSWMVTEGFLRSQQEVSAKMAECQKKDNDALARFVGIPRL